MKVRGGSRMREPATWPVPADAGRQPATERRDGRRHRLFSRAFVPPCSAVFDGPDDRMITRRAALGPDVRRTGTLASLRCDVAAPLGVGLSEKHANRSGRHRVAADSAAARGPLEFDEAGGKQRGEHAPEQVELVHRQSRTGGGCPFRAMTVPSRAARAAAGRIAPRWCASRSRGARRAQRVGKRRGARGAGSRRARGAAPSLRARRNAGTHLA